MQTIYYRTEHFIRHQGNLVDLAAYRQKLSAVSGGDLAPVLEEPVPDAEPRAQGPELYLLPKPAPMSPRRRSAGLALAKNLDRPVFLGALQKGVWEACVL